ncbi:MAG TPA: HNH endonuclease signature motif containing protein [Thermoanaerobaculia bacterium]|nr:HNH endonuclease signature motif containing protein [Thermoanaerobaculia bacterium]
MRSALWRSLLEPLLRLWPGYPPDWERRRLFVFERASGRCESCGLPAGRIDLRNGRWRVVAAHVHHVIPIAAGGRHGFANLRLLCAACHQAAHPENRELGRSRKR